MDRTDFCNRVGCGKGAEAVLLMVPQTRRAWIVETSHEKAQDGSPLCEVHVGRTTVPVGWVLTETRSNSEKNIKKSSSISPPDTTQDQIIEDAYLEPDLNIEIPLEDAVIISEYEEFKQEVPEREILEDLTSEPFEESFLQVVPDNGFDEEITQGSLWDDNEESAQLPPGEEAPHLQRAFRLVSDE